MSQRIAVYTDIGKKKINQDAYMVRRTTGSCGTVWMAALCDGMGGGDDGELASEGTIQMLERWFEQELRQLLLKQDWEEDLRQSITSVLSRRNEELIQYGRENNKKVGTTASVLLHIGRKYYLIHVGDSRIYQFTRRRLSQLTQDHSLVASEVRKGNLTIEEAKKDKRRNILLQCIGVRGDIHPEFCSVSEKGTGFLLCSDGFVHENSDSDIWKKLKPNHFCTEKKMQEKLKQMTDYAIAHGETDNITTELLYE